MITLYDENNPEVACQKCGFEVFEPIEPDECNEVGIAIGDDAFQATRRCGRCGTENYFNYVLVSVAS